MWLLYSLVAEIPSALALLVFLTLLLGLRCPVSPLLLTLGAGDAADSFQLLVVSAHLAPFGFARIDSPDFYERPRRFSSVRRLMRERRSLLASESS